MPRLGGHEQEITAYFSDIQGFSTFSEKIAPDRLVELMNEYLTACTDIVQEEGGTLLWSTVAFAQTPKIVKIVGNNARIAVPGAADRPAARNDALPVDAQIRPQR